MNDELPSTAMPHEGPAETTKIDLLKLMPVRRIVCAAIRGSHGKLLLGVRHYSQDMIEQMSNRLDGVMFRSRHNDDQGFVDQYGTYLTRETAYDVALAAGQIRDMSACSSSALGRPRLHSEALY